MPACANKSTTRERGKDLGETKETRPVEVQKLQKHLYENNKGKIEKKQ